MGVLPQSHDQAKEFMISLENGCPKKKGLLKQASCRGTAGSIHRFEGHGRPALHSDNKPEN